MVVSWSVSPSFQQNRLSGGWDDGTIRLVCTALTGPGDALQPLKSYRSVVSFRQE